MPDCATWQIGSVRFMPDCPSQVCPIVPDCVSCPTRPIGIARLLPDYLCSQPHKQQYIFFWSPSAIASFMPHVCPWVELLLGSPTNNNTFFCLSPSVIASFMPHVCPWVELLLGRGSICVGGICHFFCVVLWQARPQGHRRWNLFLPTTSDPLPLNAMLGGPRQV